MRFIVWPLRAFIFFTLFAFALNNQQAATVRWFFGVEWHAPMVIIVLVAFAAGCALGVAAMLPNWWRHWRSTRQARREAAPAAPAAAPQTAPPSEFASEHPPRIGV
ncbi:LapA_dom domain-containing protein [Rubrivivax sp. A210]|uniref:LapA family protein n=1 Tax=Rubrivivax sp. A210 TaxID=2772301 RepID=UPI0019197E77|nr:LapA family protein [Rubrivivax sp. A210]CAD5373660.1 LapA_dom domain-containing protein [Rubrivivax sp. A210]